MSDRRVHASMGQMELVRYERAGKWYLEVAGCKRRPFTIAQAASMAGDFLRSGGTVHFGLPGGMAFDSKVRRIRG